MSFDNRRETFFLAMAQQTDVESLFYPFLTAFLICFWVSKHPFWVSKGTKEKSLLRGSATTILPDLLKNQL